MCNRIAQHLCDNIEMLCARGVVIAAKGLGIACQRSTSCSNNERGIANINIKEIASLGRRKANQASQHMLKRFLFCSITGRFAVSECRSIVDLI